MTEILQDEKGQINKLKDPKLLLNIVTEVQKKGVVGEEDTIIVTINKINLRKVKEANPTSSNLAILDDTGGGKDHVVKNTCQIILPKNKYVHRTDISEKTFDYWQPEKPKDEWEVNDAGKPIPTYDSWDEYVIHLEDPRENSLNGQSFKVMSSGGTEVTKVIDYKAKDIKIEGKPVIIITSLITIIDIEGIRRWDSKRIDTTISQTNAINKFKLQKASGLLNYKPDNLLIKALHNNIHKKKVIIPYATELFELIPDSLITRTQTDKFLDAIKSSAVLHQHQREKIDENTIKADGFDLAYGWYTFLVLNGEQGIPTNKDEEELINVLAKANYPLSFNEVSSLFTRHTKQWIYDNHEKLVNKGLIKIFYQYDEKANKEIAKMTLGDNSFLVLKGFNAVLKFAEQRGFKGFKGFKEICIDINNKRIKNKLTRTFIHVFPENLENLENPSIEGSLKPFENQLKTKSLNDKILELKNYCDELEAKKLLISYENLCFNFDPSFIEKCKKEKFLIPDSKGGYSFNGEN